jgi:hypothetical protein
MPMPVSETVMVIPSGLSAAYSVTVPPCGVYLMALESRSSTTWRSRRPSPSRIRVQVIRLVRVTRWVAAAGC